MWETCKVWLARYNLWDDRAALKLLSRPFFPVRRQPQTITRIVAYRVGNIGDTVVAIPALAALRDAFPQARITMLTSAGNAALPGAEDVLSAFPGLVDRVVSYLPADVKSVKGLRQLKAQITESEGPIDLWVSLPVTLQSVLRGFREMLMARWLGSRSAFGFTLLLPEVFRTEFARNQPLPKTSDWLLSIVHDGFQQMAHLPPESTPTEIPEATTQHKSNAPQSAPPYLRHFKSPAPNLRHRLGLSAERPLLVVNAGAKLAIKRWPEAYFQQTLSQVLARLPVVQVVLLGNQTERNWNENIASQLPGIVLNAAGQLTLAETWSLLQHASAVLTNDTGTMHMAGLLQKAVFTPMSGQYPAPLWHPPGPDIQIFSKTIACAPCFKDHCPLPQQLCLTELSPTPVAEALYAHLKSCTP